jgi:hypothetical protein
MSVNPQLATLMGLIDELQEQMPEGKYLEAMNALRDLHGVCPIPRPPPPPPVAFVPPEGGVILSVAEQDRHRRIRYAVQEYNENLPSVLMALQNHLLWKVVVEEWNESLEEEWRIEESCLPKSWHRHIRWRTERFVPEIETWWMAKTAEEKKKTIKKALMTDYAHAVDQYHRDRNPAVSVCPFVSRHAIGKWDHPDRTRAKWNCVCGSVNILVKNWRQHEASEKHVKWHEAGRHLDDGKRRTMLDKVATMWNVTKNKAETFEPSMLDRSLRKGVAFADKHEIRQGVTTRGYTIAGIHGEWYIPHHIGKPQSANEWICSDLKGKPWDYEPPMERWIKEPTRPTWHVKTNPTPNFEPAEVPQIKQEPPRMRESWCPVARRDIHWMPQEEYAIFISMEE